MNSSTNSSMNMLAKTVWITGASSGIGEALALLLDSKGYRVIVTARNTDKLNQMALKSNNIKVLSADLCDPNDIEKIQHYFEHLSLDIAIINAGTCEYMDNASLDSTAIRRVFAINFFAAVESINAALPALARAPHGHLIGVSSMSVYLPFSRAEYYASSKAAFTYYLQSLAIDIKQQGIDVSTVYPGFVETPLTQKNNFAMPFIISAEDAAQQFLEVIERKPVTFAFPKKMHWLLSLMKMLPSYWFKQQVKSVNQPTGKVL